MCAELALAQTAVGSAPHEQSVLNSRFSPTAGDSSQHDIVLPTYQQQCGSGRLPPPEPFWVPLVYWKDRLMRHSDPNDPLRHMGLGTPLQGTSWRNRPLYAGWFVGGVWGDPLTETVDQGDDLFGGYRLGWDFDHYWGTELRLAWANVDLIGVPASQSQTAGHTYYDINLLYYPLGDSRWRPYAGVGLGGANFRFDDESGQHLDETLFQLPLQIGVKYMYRKWLAVRFDLTDNLAFGGDSLDTMHNLSLSSGVEVHFGGSRRSYFPWNPSASLW
jgi:hypothetical protein